MPKILKKKRPKFYPPGQNFLTPPPPNPWMGWRCRRWRWSGFKKVVVRARGRLWLPSGSILFLIPIPANPHVCVPQGLCLQGWSTGLRGTPAPPMVRVGVMDDLGFTWPGHVGWVLLGVHAGIGPVWPYRGEAVPGLRVAKAMLALGSPRCSTRRRGPGGLPFGLAVHGGVRAPAGGPRP